MKNNFKYIAVSLIFALFFSACSQKEIKKEQIEAYKPPVDVVFELSKYAKDDFLDQEISTNAFLEKFFIPWKQNKLSYTAQDAAWGVSYKNRKVYLENHKLASPEWFDKLIANANFENYNQDIRKAITIKNSDVRVLPTSSPFFYNPKLPGEGFPFDYNQNSRLKMNTPLIVSHLSQDKAWAYIESYFVGGWVKVDDIAFVDDAFINTFQTKDYYISTKEKFPLYDPNFVEYVKIGTLFPKYNSGFLIAKKDEKSNVKLIQIQIDNNQVEKLPIKNSTENRTRILNELLDEPYGWGGLLNNRDCSSFTQDYFAVFGKYLDRNSKAQSRNGNYVDLSFMNLNEKKEYIAKNGVPFSTLVYLKGHIMLYIGVKNGEPLVAHNVWSIRLKDKNQEEFRHIIGKATITTLEPGIELEGFTNESNILGKVLGITIL